MKTSPKTVLLVFLCLGLPTATVHAQTKGSEVISGPAARRFGLERAWVAQVHLDRTREKMDNAVLSGDGVFVNSSFGVLQALDAETGATRWIAQFGNRYHPGTGPGVGQQYVAVTKGTSLFVVDRATGSPVMERSLKHVTLTSPAVLGKHVYVAVLNSMISSYNVSKPRSAPAYYRGSGQIVQPPLATPKTLAWATNSGSLYASSPEKLGVRFQFKAKEEIVAPLGYQSPYIFAASRDGFIYAINEINGRMVWRFAAGSPITQPPVAIRDSLFLIPEEGGMYCLSVRTGHQQWFTPQVAKFLAASPTRDVPVDEEKPKLTGGLARIYAASALGDTLILDAKTGVRLATIPTANLPWKLTNSENDRLYFGTSTGLIQCFHEIGADQPVRFTPLAPALPTTTGETPGVEAPADAAPTDSTTPPTPEAMPSDEPNPFDEEPK